jgi:hypothetical protein
MKELVIDPATIAAITGAPAKPMRRRVARRGNGEALPIASTYPDGADFLAGVPSSEFDFAFRCEVVHLCQLCGCHFRACTLTCPGNNRGFSAAKGKQRCQRR